MNRIPNRAKTASQRQPGLVSSDPSELDPEFVEGQRRLFWCFAGQGVEYQRGREFIVIDGGRDD